MSDGPPAREALLHLENIEKGFPGVQALRGVDFTLRAGEIHALVGENGSGKSTLTKIVSGEYQPDAGAIYFQGQRVQFRAPAESIRAGISAIAQEIPLVPQLSIAENILLGRLPTRRRTVDWSRAYEHASTVLATLEADHLDPRRLIETLPLDQKQLVSIARALSTDSKVIIFDEATSSLTTDEVEALFRVIGNLRDRGVGIVFITHRLREIYAIAEVVTVLRDGAVIGTLPIAEAPEVRLTRMMVGRELGEYFFKQDVPRGDKVLQVRGLHHHTSPAPLDFDVRTGEIVGLAGLVGAGRSELLASLFGLGRSIGGDIRVDGKTVRVRHPRDAIAAGFALVPEDRKSSGLVANRSVRENLTMAENARMFPQFVVSGRSERQTARELVSQLQIRTPDIETPVRLLSGGNQQKVVIGKWLTQRPKIWLLDEPTRGIDVGAKSEIFRLIGELAASGTAILMSSSELIDLLGVCDRILVMFRGRIVAELTRDEATEESVIYYATGQSVA
ncbi:MAG: sugar ABC transporter ATP-binding protein [Ilumatobacteraceae bacterium]